MENVVVINRSVAYLTKKQLEEELNYSGQTINSLIKGIQEEIAKGRYHRCVIAGNRYNLYAFLDYMTYKKQLVDKNMRKSVPAFDPVAIAEMCGFHTKVVRM